MNKAFAPFLYRFVIVDLDDITIYSKTMEEHIGHLQEVVRTLRDNELYVNKKKCSFT